MNLLELRNKKILAQNGHDILKEKRDALIMEFYNILEEVREAQSEADEVLIKAHKQLEVASLKMGMAKLREIGFSAPEVMSLNTTTRNIMGVRTPKLSLKKREISTPFYAAEYTSVALDDSIGAFRNYLYSVVHLAEKIATLQKLAFEIANTNRRVNALNHIVIPRLDNTAKFIDLALEEEAREDFSKLKFIKAKLDEKDEEVL